MMRRKVHFAEKTRHKRSGCFYVLELRLLTINNRLDYLYMTARNEYIEKLIISTHAKILRPRPLSVFCVSNKAYKYNRPRAKAHVLSIKGSGIPLLRQHCHKIPSRAQFRIGHHFLTVSVKSLVQQVQLWLVGGSPETLPNHATVQRLLESLQGDLKMVSRAYAGFIKYDVLVLLDTFNFVPLNVTKMDVLPSSAQRGNCLHCVSNSEVSNTISLLSCS